jgi:mannitol operon repressor
VTDKTPTEQYVEYRDEVWDKDPHYRGLFDTLKELTEETDRGVALVTTSFLDRLLGDTLAAFLIENASAKVLLSGFNAPLGTLNTKIAACHALGLITDEEFGQCSIFRKVRNEFAHEIQVSFKSGKVKDLCDNLVISSERADDDARAKFARSSMSLLVALVNRPREVADERLECGEWVASQSIRTMR